MDKKRLSRILAASPREAVINLAEEIMGNYPVVMIKPPAKTLVMLTVKEPVKNSRFFLGEAIASECLLEVAGHRGASVMLGDDFEKARAAAILDAANSAALPVMRYMNAIIEVMEAEMMCEWRKEAAMHRKTQVQFQIMEDRNAEEA